MERLIPFRWLLEPVIGVLFLTLWLLAQLGQDVRGTITMVFLCGAIALSRIAPSTALGIAALGVLLDLIDVVALPTSGQWCGYLALLLAVTGIVSHGRPVTRWLALAGALLVGPIGAYLLLFAAESSIVPAAPGGAGALVRTVLVVLMLSIGQVMAWLLGFVVGRQRLTQRSAGSSVLVWLAQSGGAVTPQAAPGNDEPVLVRRLSRTQLVLDVVIAAAFFLLAAVGVFGQSTHALLVLLGLSIALALRRLSPPVALGVAWFSAIGQMLGGGGITPGDVAILAVLYATSAYGDRITRWAGLISAGVGAIVAALYLTLTSALSQTMFSAVSSRLGELALQFVFLAVVSATVLGLSWVLGLLARTWRNARVSRRAQIAAEEQRQRAQQSVVVEQERNRIARDMHDVVAHSLAVVIAQADGARYARHADPESVDEALKTISTTAREALGDVRLLLGELRHSQGSGPQPGIDDLQRLLEQLNHAGLPVAFTQEGVPTPLGGGLQMAIYRIVQEALTNALRHGDTNEEAQLVIDWRQDGVKLTVINRMPLVPALPSGARGGHGVPGMRERATLAGGWLSAEPGNGLFTVSAYLPSAVGPHTGTLA